MPSGFNVTAETLQADATRIATGADNIQGHLAFLQNAVSSVVNSGWVGTAAQSAAALHEKLDKAGRDVKERCAPHSPVDHRMAQVRPLRSLGGRPLPYFSSRAARPRRLGGDQGRAPGRLTSGVPEGCTVACRKRYNHPLRRKPR
jgi:uncharacterized protein YukE